MILGDIYISGIDNLRLMIDATEAMQHARNRYSRLTDAIGIQSNIVSRQSQIS